MIILPALAGIVAILQTVAEGAALGALFGALFGGAIAGGVEVVTGFHEYGEVNQTVIENAAKRAGDEAIHGAVGGAVTGGLFGFAGTAFHPVLAMIDDFFRSVFSWLDDAARSVAGAVDDVARSVASTVDDAVTGIKNAAKSVVNGIRAWINHTRNVRNAANFKSMVDAPAGTKYVYVIEDSANRLHKIGMTTKAPPDRLNTLKNGTKSKLDYTCIIQTDKNSKLETTLHSMYSKQRTNHPTPHDGRTEWFVLSAAQVAAACSH